MSKVSCDILVVGGGLGGVAAALAIAESGYRVLLSEETDWIGGQLTSQAVPPDEHRWIESFGCTARYRNLRDRLRQIYLRDPSFIGEGTFNPGSGWVSAITARPDFWHQAMQEMVTPHVEAGTIEILTRTVLSGGSQLSGFKPERTAERPKLGADSIESVTLRDLESEEAIEVKARFFLDATELGDLIELSGSEWTTGSESREETGEKHAPSTRRADNQQALTWIFSMGYEAGANHTIDRPDGYGTWRQFQPPFWPNPLFNLQDLDPVTNLPRTPPLPLFSSGWRSWFKYRQIFDPSVYSPSTGFPTTIVNWPQNDYFLGEVINVSPEVRWQRLFAAKEQSKCLLYWLQTECPGEDGFGYPGLFASPSYLGSSDGFALTPYIRESRRIRAMETILEPAVSADASPAGRLPRPIKNSVGIGSYRIDLHPSTGGDAYIDLATLPFQIPLGSLIPIRTRNLLPACKNIGASHITNGCYRLHPVEWNIGEAAGFLASYCLTHGVAPQDVFKREDLTDQFIETLRDQGIETKWPEKRMFDEA